MFCLAMRRDAFERIGPLDARFQVGMLEDDDYSLRAHEAGYRVVCTEDILVHHFGESSFGKLVASGEYNRLLDENKQRFEEKWGRPWEPYQRRPKPQYDAATRRIAELVAERLPGEATIAVISRGDQRLLEVSGAAARHFPESAPGVWAGHHPATAPRRSPRSRRCAPAGSITCSCRRRRCGGSTTTRAFARIWKATTRRWCATRGVRDLLPQRRRGRS